MRTLFLPLLVVPLLFASCQKKEAKVSAVNFVVLPLGDGVYACISTFGGKAICNAGIVDNGESTIIFDTFLSPDAADELIRVTKLLNVSPIRYVINSHYHNDHVRGNQCFPPEVKFLSTRRTAELIASKEPKSLVAEKVYGSVRYHHSDSLYTAYKGDTTASEFQALKTMRAYFQVLSESHDKIRTRVPDTYVEGATSLDGSKRKVRLLDKGKGHTESDMILYLPDDSTVFAGDLVFNKSHPYLADGSLEGWKKILAEMELMPVKTVVPGHGDVGGSESIKTMREYIESVEAVAGKLRKEGAPREEIKKVPIPGSYKDWWLEDDYRENVGFVYDTLK